MSTTKGLKKTTKTVYVCADCGESVAKWQGQCPSCTAWNTLKAFSGSAPSRGERARAPAAMSLSQALSLDDTRLNERHDTTLAELNRVLGGGLVKGSVTLIGGDPGIGKSTLLLHVAAALARACVVLYATGEESVHQVALRAKRVGVDATRLSLLAETNLETILDTCAQLPELSLLVIDSVQTMASSLLESSAGSVLQLRECTARLVEYAKRQDVAVVLIGHVTKDGQIAGPRVLEHLVDTVLYFESDSGSRFRLLRTIKNRFGAAGELGLFVMEADGLKEVRNPSAMFLKRAGEPVAGSVVTVTREGTRPMLLEVQVLADASRLENPRRVAVGLDHQRLSLLLAVLSKHGGIGLGACDVFANVAGGLKISETAADLAWVLAAVSSVKELPLSQQVVVFGELGLSGEVRPVAFGEERLKEAVKHGFTQAIIPKANAPKTPIDGLTITAVTHLKAALAALNWRA
jgi:DNA repair protein RadA/Sms